MNESEISRFLVELFNLTTGDTEKQVSMYDVGVALGMEKTEAGSLAEELIMDELVELKTLAGGVGITSKGVEMLGKSGLVHVPSSSAYKLSGKPVLDEDDRVKVSKLLQEVQASLATMSVAYEPLEQIVIDIKTVEVQMLSSQPKAAIVRPILFSLKTSLENQDNAEIAAMINGALQ